MFLEKLQSSSIKRKEPMLTRLKSSYHKGLKNYANLRSRRKNIEEKIKQKPHLKELIKLFLVAEKLQKEALKHGPHTIKHKFYLKKAAELEPRILKAAEKHPELALFRKVIQKQRNMVTALNKLKRNITKAENTSSKQTTKTTKTTKVKQKPKKGFSR